MNPLLPVRRDSHSTGNPELHLEPSLGYLSIYGVCLCMVLIALLINLFSRRTIHPSVPLGPPNLSDFLFLCYRELTRDDQSDIGIAN